MSKVHGRVRTLAGSNTCSSKASDECTRSGRASRPPRTTRWSGGPENRPFATVGEITLGFPHLLAGEGRRRPVKPRGTCRPQVLTLVLRNLSRPTRNAHPASVPGTPAAGTGSSSTSRRSVAGRTRLRTPGRRGAPAPVRSRHVRASRYGCDHRGSPRRYRLERDAPPTVVPERVTHRLRDLLRLLPRCGLTDDVWQLGRRVRAHDTEQPQRWR